MAVHQKVKQNMRSNLAIFKMYVERNLSLRSQQRDDKEEWQRRGEELSQSLSLLQEKKEELQFKVDGIQRELALGQALHASLSKALYSLRVGAQAFEDPSIHPLLATMSSLASKRSQLSRIVAHAEGKGNCSHHGPLK